MLHCVVQYFQGSVPLLSNAFTAVPVDGGCGDPLCDTEHSVALVYVLVRQIYYLRGSCREWKYPMRQ